MSKICIISNDARYDILCDILRDNGYNAYVCPYDDVEECDVLILPIKSALTDEEFSKIFQGIKSSTLVFCGEAKRAGIYFDGRIINFAVDEEFIDKNAYITAECAISLAMTDSRRTICSRNCAIVGYGRIGKHLTRILVALGARVSVFARREESRAEARERGARGLEISELNNEKYDFVFNTVPIKVISREQSDEISKQTLVYDLASLPGGFENEDFPKRALALPGKMMPLSSAEAIYDFVIRYIS